MAAFSNKIYGKMWDDFCLNTGKHFLEDILFQSQKKDLMFLKKYALRDF